MQIKGKLNIKRGETKLVSHFWRPKTWSEEEEGRRRREEKRYGSLVFCMETKIFVWFVWIVMGWYEFVNFYINFLLELGFEVLKSMITC